ncbi:MAG: DUF6092 family protein [Chloroflexota bacterium]
MPEDQRPPADLKLTEKQALDLLAYLASSAEISLHEPTYYGTFRLIDAASRLMGALLESNPDLAESFMPEWKADIDTRKVWMMWDRPAYFQFLKESPAVIAGEIRRREEAAQ